MVKLTAGRLPGSSPGGRQQALLSELLQFTGDQSSPPDEDLTQDIVDRAFKALLEFAETARSRDDYCQLCSFVRALIPRHRVRMAFGLLLTANPDLKSRLSVVASEAADFFAKKRQEILSRFTNIQGTFLLARGPSTATSMDGELIDVTLADNQWSAMGVLLVLGKLVCEVSSDIMVSLALDKESMVAFASLALELMSFHSLIYSLPSSTEANKRGISGTKSFGTTGCHALAASRNKEEQSLPRVYSTEPMHGASPYSPKLSCAFRSALSEEEEELAAAKPESTIVKVPKRRSTRKGTLRNKNKGDPPPQPIEVYQKPPSHGQEEESPTKDEELDRTNKGPATPPALGSLVSLATRRTRASAVARYDSDSSGVHSVDDSPSSHPRCPPSVMATLGRGTLPSEVSGGIDELQSRTGIDQTCYTMTAARQEAMCLLPRVYDWLLAGSIGILTAELPQSGEKLLSILNYYNTASAECMTFRFSAVTLILHMLLRTPPLMSSVFDSIQGSVLLLKLTAKLANSRRRSSTSPTTSRKLTAADTGGFSDDCGAEIIDPMTYDVITATSAGKIRSSAWNWWRRIRCFPTSSATRSRRGLVSSKTKEDSVWTMTVIGIFEEVCADILLAMVGSCFVHSLHNISSGAAGGSSSSSAQPTWTKQQPLPNDGGITTSTPSALNQRLPQGDFYTCTTPAIVALRTCESEVLTLLKVACETQPDSASMESLRNFDSFNNFALNVLSPLESRSHAALRAYRRQAAASRLVAYRYKVGFLCSYCGSSARQTQRTSGKTRSSKSLQDCDRCFMARYCSPQCLKADTTLHKAMCRGFA